MSQSRYQKMARATAAKHGVPVRLFLSLVDHESSWQPNATSHAGAIGLTQLMPATAKGLGVDPWNPKQNLEGGARYLSTQYKKLGSWRDALRAYNYGPSGAAENPSNGLEYANAVLQGRNAAKSLDVPKKGGGVTGRPGLKQPFGVFQSTPGKMSLGDMAAFLFPEDKDFAFLAKQLDVGGDFPTGAPGGASPVGGGAPLTGTAPINALMPSDNVGARAVRAAATQLGDPYVFGASSAGANPRSFDCSSLVQWAYRQVGIDIPRDTYGQQRVLKQKSWRDLRPGDPIYRRSGGHVVIYAGNNQVIAAPHTGTVVQYQPLSNFSQSEYVPYVIPH